VSWLPSGNEKLQPLGTLGLAALAFCASAVPEMNSASVKVNAYGIVRIIAGSPFVSHNDQQSFTGGSKFIPLIQMAGMPQSLMTMVTFRFSGGSAPSAGTGC
jgi:hypothetical protein